MQESQEKYIQQIINTLDNEDEKMNKLMFEVMVHLLNKNQNDILTEKYLLELIEKIKDSKDA